MLGEQPPRFRNVPAGAVDSWGPETIDLAASVGLTMDQGQADLLTDGMSERADGKWLAREVADDEPRQNGKTVVLEARSLGGLLLVKEPLIVWTAHEFKTTVRSFLKMKHYFTEFDALRKRVRAIRNSGAVTEIELFNPTRHLVFLARSGGSGRGFASVAPLFLDEAYALTQEQIAALIYAMSAAPNPQVWEMSSAPLVNSEPFRDIVLRGRRGAPGIIYYEWSASGTLKELTDLATRVKLLHVAGVLDEHPEIRERFFQKTREANRALTTNPPRLTEEGTLSELSVSGIEQFLRERWGAFSELEEGGKIEPERWKDLGDLESTRAGDCSLAVDISIEQDYSAIGMYALREDGLGHVQLIHYQHGTQDLVNKLNSYRDALDPVAVGMGRATYAALREQLKAAGYQRPEDRPVEIVRNEGDSSHPPKRGDLIVLDGPALAAATGGFLESVRAGTMRHVPTDHLDRMVKVAKTRIVGDAMRWVKTDTTDITGLTAVTSAKRAHEARVNEIEEYDPTQDIF